jgi:hypothetical protein
MLCLYLENTAKCNAIVTDYIGPIAVFQISGSFFKSFKCLCCCQRHSLFPLKCVMSDCFLHNQRHGTDWVTNSVTHLTKSNNFFKMAQFLSIVSQSDHNNGKGHTSNAPIVAKRKEIRGQLLNNGSSSVFRIVIQPVTIVQTIYITRFTTKNYVISKQLLTNTLCTRSVVMCIADSTLWSLTATVRGLSSWARNYTLCIITRAGLRAFSCIDS